MDIIIENIFIFHNMIAHLKTEGKAVRSGTHRRAGNLHDEVSSLFTDLCRSCRGSPFAVRTKLLHG